jgi:hypothetical protein
MEDEEDDLDLNAYLQDQINSPLLDGVFVPRPWAEADEETILRELGGPRRGARADPATIGLAQQFANVEAVQLSPGESAMIERLMATGEARSTVIQAFIACDRNEPAAFGLLLGMRD